MSIRRPFGDHAACYIVGAIVMGFLAGTRAPIEVWIFVLGFTGLYFLMRRMARRISPRENRKRIKEEKRCQELLKQAYDACRRASENAVEYHKTWQDPANKAVRQALFGPEEVDLPELFEILMPAWKAGERNPELALHLMHTSWDLWEQAYDDYTCTLDGQALFKAFQEPYRYLGGHESDNCTLLLTAAHMILLFDYRTGLSLGDAEACLQRFLKLCPDGIPVSEFAQRGNFGDYFTHIITPHQFS